MLPLQIQCNELQGMHQQLHPGQAGVGWDTLLWDWSALGTLWGPASFSRTLMLWGALEVPG